MNLMDLATPNGLFCDGDWIEKKDQDPQGSVRLIQLADIGVCQFKNKSSRYVTKETCLSLHCTTLQQGDILIARLPDPLGRACIFPLDGSYITAVDVAILRIKRPDIDSKYIMYLINSPQFRNAIKQYESGTTRKRISRKNLERIEFNVPPLDEQQRVVARIEELFSQLDSAVATLNTIKQQLAVYRQLVLHSVFTSIDSDDYQKLDSIILDGPHNGIYKPKSEYGEGIRILRIDGFYDGKILDDYKWQRLSLTLEEIDKYCLKVSDIVINRVNSMSHLGKCALVRVLNETTVFESNMMRLRVDTTRVNPEFLVMYLSSQTGRNELTKNAKQAVNQASINQTDVRNAHIPLPDLSTQNKLLQKAKKKLAVCERIEDMVDTTRQQANALRQSILKKAFEGRL